LFILFRNVFVLVTSGDLFRLYGIGFNLAFVFLFQCFSGIILCWLFSVGFLSWFSLLFVSDFDWGFCCRCLHIVFTSFCYFLLYCHLFKVFIYLVVFDCALFVWFCGFFIYLLLIVIAFLGYVLPMSQMSYWGLTVFSNILTTVPIVGEILCYWLWGCEFINDYTLIKCHCFHIFIPFVFLWLVFVHFFCLHFYMSSDGFCDRFALYCERLLFFS